MKTRVGTLLIAALTLAACNPGLVDRGRTPDDPLAPPGAMIGGEGVDPLIVGDRLLDAGEAELALASYTRAAAEHGITPDIKLSMAVANIKLGRLHQAERQLRDVLRQEPENARAMNNLGVVLLDLGKTGEAERMFRAAFALQPTPEIRENLRVASAKLENRAYNDHQEEDAFTLTRRANGVYDLSSPGQQP